MVTECFLSLFSFSELFRNILRKEVLILKGFQIYFPWTRIPDLSLSNQNLLLLHIDYEEQKNSFPNYLKGWMFLLRAGKSYFFIPRICPNIQLSHKEILKIFIWKMILVPYRNKCLVQKIFIIGKIWIWFRYFMTWF